VKRLARHFDMLHFHTDLVHFPVFSASGHATLTTLHGRQDLFELQDFYSTFPDMPLVSISDAQRLPIADANFAGTVLHGLPTDLLAPTYRPSGNYLAFLGRISPEKRVDRAIEIARRGGLQLLIAAKVDRADESYFRECIAPLLEGEGVTFVGEITERQKARFLGEARVLLFPINWPEPFGLVMIEAMACGTPVLAFNCGSVPEVIDAGVTGCIVNDMGEADQAVRWAMSLDRRRVRERFERRFTARRMAEDYVLLYEGLLGAKHVAPSIVPFTSASVRRHVSGNHRSIPG
jgi:glycosyltransferase involved in cell wall biosynthesis